jgi:predicted MPP superfamily phosphohydrolase
LTNIDLKRLLKNLQTRELAGLVQQINTQSQSWQTSLAMRILVSGMGFTALCGLIVWLAGGLCGANRRRLAGLQLMALGVCATLLIVSLGMTAWSYQPQKLASGQYRGDIALAPKLLGAIQSSLTKLDDIADETGQILTSVAALYGNLQTTPSPQSFIRVLHISDTHLQPYGLAFADQVAEAFNVDAILDTGDLTSYGTPFEPEFAASIARFDRPYLFVSGNHDSPAVVARLRQLPLVEVLDGNTATIKGLSIYGKADPVFTEDESGPELFELGTLNPQIPAAGAEILEDLQKLSEPPDVVAVHDQRMVEAIAGHMPLVVSGHFHRQAQSQINGTLFLQGGSTGAAGLNLLSDSPEQKLSVQVLYFTPGGELVEYYVIEKGLAESVPTIQPPRYPQVELGPLIPSPASSFQQPE